MSTSSTILLVAGTVALALTIGGNVYETIVCIPSWRRPGGLEAWRAFTGDRHAGRFFLTFAPASLLLLAAGAALGRSVLALGATLAVLIALVFTRVYFMPRNRLLFAPATATKDAAEARALLEQWIRANWVRVSLAACGLVMAGSALRG